MSSRATGWPSHAAQRKLDGGIKSLEDKRERGSSVWLSCSIRSLWGEANGDAEEASRSGTI